MEDNGTTEIDLRLKAMAPLPTPVEAKACTRMWIPAARLTAEHHIDEILRSLASDTQPEIWRHARPHLRDFVRIPHQGIAFLCTSDTALHNLGGIQLKICDTPVTIRKYSLYDKLYFVDLLRLPNDVPDQRIYEWFVEREARPVLITPTYVHGLLQSRGRTIYFGEVGCPKGLFDSDGNPLREIYFVEDDKPCFVQHRLRKYNRAKPPSLRQPPRRVSTISADASMEGDDASMGEGESAPVLPTTLDSERDSPPSASATPVARPRERKMILGSVSAEQDPEWKLVQHAQYGILNRSGKFLEPAGATPCELSEDAKDPTALVYSMPLLANYYDVLTAEAYDESTPPDVDIAAAQDDDAISGFTSDTPLLPLAAVRSLKEARTMPVKAEQLSASELQEIIQEYIERDVLNYTSHEDVLAAIQVQPSYFRRIFWLPDDCQRQMFLSHAVYRAVCAEPTAAGESTDFLSRLRARYGDDAAANPAGLFDRMFKEESRRAALNCAISDLFLMIFSPGIYVDPVKVDVLLPMTMPPKRLRNTPFLLWGDVNLLLASCS
ncbi:hypothetical protein JM18_009196 [Phytophthora kernoviae]|uniref:Uncharacterized protein n=1 Tax=Phytophthora kernoviae TaxID=325452 RepID=A0A8T0LJ05_9STRA|nr:hypothetical protein JM16_008483 [Phytophthora kernoviae]KAG2508565.1 hypothetical protein JM18_009196 [Phytophthora kernoviae]